MHNNYKATAVNMIVNINGGELQTIRLGLIKEDSFVVFTELFRSYYIAIFEEENVFPMQYVSFEYALSLRTVFYDATGHGELYSVEDFCKIKKPNLMYCETGVDTNWDSQYIERLANSPLKELIEAAISNSQKILDAKEFAKRLMSLPPDMFDQKTSGLSKIIGTTLSSCSDDSMWDKFINIRCIRIVMNAFENKLKEIN